jgi:predicted AAA+ superfamily ATPase
MQSVALLYARILPLVRLVVRRSKQTARLSQLPAVTLLDPRQVGMTALARSLMADRTPPPLYLDLEQPEDRSQLTDPALFLRDYADRLVVLDEVQRVPGLFEVLRGLIDERRRGGSRHGHFLLLGSASLDLLRQSAESLAGRIAYVEMTGFSPPSCRPPAPIWTGCGYAAGSPTVSWLRPTPTA